MAGVNAGDSDFNFLLPTPGRTQGGNYVSLFCLVPTIASCLLISLSSSWVISNFAFAPRVPMHGQMSRLTSLASLQSLHLELARLARAAC